MVKAFVTGSAGFIGFHHSKRLLEDGWEVVGLDNLSDYYDVTLKTSRHAILQDYDGFTAVIGGLEDRQLIDEIFEQNDINVVVHLAAQAGVRYSIDAPESYVQSNLIGAFNILEAVRHNPVDHLLMASTSSVYGANEEMPYTETDRTVTQKSFYAATKAANEAMAHSYAHLYGQPTTMFRFFTVYGPWGRPDMAYFSFAKAILEGRPIDVFNNGEMRRDFTFVDDLVEALTRLIPVAPVRPEGPNDAVKGDSLSPVAPFRVVNIGNASPVGLMEFIQTLENALGKQAEMNMLPMQPGDVTATWADTSLLQGLTGYVPSTPLESGIAQFVDWYRSYYS